MTKRIEDIVATGDLTELNPEQRATHYMQVCEAMGVDYRLQPLRYMTVDDPNGGQRLILYALKGATDQIRKNRGIKITKLTKEFVEDVVIFTAEATDRDGGTDISTGAVSTKGKKGSEFAEVIMSAETKAKRRVTLSISGSGLLDESEVANLNGPTPVTPGIGVTVAPNLSTPAANSAPAKEVVPAIPATPAKKPIVDTPKLSETAQAPVEPVKVEFHATELPATLPPHSGSVLKVIEAPTPAVEAPASVNPELDKDKINARITAYKRDICPAGGMRPSKGFGINAKVIKFFAVSAGKKNFQDVAAEEILIGLAKLDEVRAASGDQGVVALIDKAIAA
jgi:hypothetical protein